MADVTVDAKPMEKLPYDPNDIPEAVKKRAAAVDALYNQTAKLEEPQPSTTPESTIPPVVTPTPPQAQDPAPPAPPASAESRPSDDENAESWKVRYHRMQGQFTASQKTIGEMQEQMTQLGNELLHMQQHPPQQRQAPTRSPPPAYLTEQDVQQYGNELIDVTQRAALHALSPELQTIKDQNAELQRQLALEARHRLDQAVELAVPNYREIDRDPRWHRWLLGVDLYTGRVRQTLLNEAIAQAAAPRVISFFKGFQNEEAATGHSQPASYSPQAAAPREPALNLVSLAAPGRARPATGGDASLPTEKPIYTRAQVKQLYDQQRRGAYVGREAEWARLEADLFTAQREGRYR